MKKVILFVIIVLGTMAMRAAPAAAQATPTATATATATPTATATATLTATATSTATATATATSTATATATATPVIINETGVAGVPVTIAACGSSSTKVITGRRTNTTWTVMCEADCRCELGDSSDNPPIITPTATVGFLFKANTMVNEASLGLGSSVVTLRLDCCGVSGSTSADTWQE